MASVSKTDLHVGKRVLAARERLGVSREALASQLRVTPQQMQMFEEGESLISAERLDHVARVLRIDVSYFYQGLNEAASEGRRGLLKRSLQRFAPRVL